MIEELFQVRRRRAQQLLERFGGFQSGRRWLIERENLVQALEAIQRGDPLERELRRRERLEEALGEIRRIRTAKRVTIAADVQKLEGLRLAGLPPTVELLPGALHITFKGAEDLLTQLYVLSQAIANDFAAVERLTSSTSNNT
jgi:hypothetical protein